MGGRDQSQVKNKSLKKFEKVKSVPKTYPKVITMTLVQHYIQFSPSGKYSTHSPTSHESRLYTLHKHIIYTLRTYLFRSFSRVFEPSVTHNSVASTLSRPR